MKQFFLEGSKENKNKLKKDYFCNNSLSFFKSNKKLLSSFEIKKTFVCCLIKKVPNIPDKRVGKHICFVFNVIAIENKPSLVPDNGIIFFHQKIYLP